MKQLLLFVLLAGVGLAQAPTDTLVTKLAERDTPQKHFLRENPAATDVLRYENATHFRNPDGTYTAIFGATLNYVDANSQLQPVAPEMWQTDAGYREIGTPNPVRIVTVNRSQDTVEIWNGTRVATATTPKLTKTGDWTWTFPWGQITWTLEVTNGGWNVTSQQIAAARGSYTYQMPLASTGLNLVPDADGNLADGTFRITRAVMARADGVQTPCSAWAVGSKGISFTCDDSGLPARAFPYVIDPSADFRPPLGADDGWVRGASASWPPQSGTSYQSANTTSPYGSELLDTLNGQYWRQQQLARFDTSSLPDNAVVNGATFSYIYADKYGGSECTLKMDWISPSIWPIGNEDYVVSQSGAAWSAGLDAINATNARNYSTMAGANNANVSVTGYSAVRTGLYKSTAPTGWPICRVYVYNAEGDGPILTVSYVLSGPKLIIVAQ